VVTHPGNYGLVGMAAVFAGAARAPITAVIILFELTGDYSVILPLMAAVVISTIVSELLSKDTIYTLKLRRRGIDLRTGKGDGLMRQISVEQAMTTDLMVLPHTLTVAEAMMQLKQTHQWAVLVVDDAGALVNVLMVHDLEEAVVALRGEELLGTIISTPADAIFLDETLEEAMRRMGVHDHKVLPVLARGDGRHPVGLLSRDDIFQAYSVALLAKPIET
ncbi:MAG: chloride channel protein, partial [Ktedonobacteraceae bacterium]|nr:chloride channel protein [Ktedonobacteraceae bacterium]